MATNYASREQRRVEDADRRNDAGMIRDAVARLEADYQALVEAQKWMRTRDGEDAISEARAGLADLRDDLAFAGKKMEG